MELHCTHCGVLIRAPKEAGGHWGKCPRCEHKIYIPTEAEPQEEEIGLAPLDDAEERRAHRQAAHDREIEQHLLEGARDVPEEPADVRPEPPGPAIGGHDVLAELLLRYVRGMAQGRLADCDSIVAALVGKKKAVTAAVQQLLTKPPPSGEVDDMPLPVVAGYLKQLLSQL
jgi:phage FluMu protein Com